jgi:hypothetical protein
VEEQGAEEMVGSGPAVVRVGEERRVGLDLLPVDVAGVVNVHPRVAEGIGSIRTPRGLDLVYERMVHGECSA